MTTDVEEFVIDDPEGLPDELTEEAAESEDPLTAEDLREIVLYSLDWSVQSILERIGETFDVNPSFQRRDAWSPSRKSSYIESVILGLPVPQIVLAEDPKKKGRFIVLDGKQRLVTLKQFGSPNEKFPPFKLKGLQFAKDVEGMTFEQMQGSLTASEHAENFLAQPIRTVVVRNWGTPAVLYEVFIRLNQNSLPLSPQELRQALFPSEFTFWINKRSAESKLLHAARRTNREDFRMRDAEMLLRFVAWKEGLSTYRGNLRQFLDDACVRGDRVWRSVGPSHYEGLADQCEKAIARTFAIFLGDSFLRYEDGYNRRFNIAVFDLMTVMLSDAAITDDLIGTHRLAVKAGFEELCTNDEAFNRSITSTTKSVPAVRERFLTFCSLLESVLGVQLEIRQHIEALTPGAS
ncbi:MAG: DUF262 domain-containing protein [Nocardioides sp.]|nr:DUF262 domain-containing protein [Nocardioides sp.]